MEKSEVHHSDMVKEENKGLPMNEPQEGEKRDQDKKPEKDFKNQETSIKAGLTDHGGQMCDKNTEEIKDKNESESVPEKINSVSDKFLEEEENIFNIEDQTIDSLSDGFLQKIQPELDSFSDSFQELTRNQRVLMETVQQENAKLSENKDIKDLADMVANAKLYHQKLVNIKKDMIQLHEKTTKIKKRALKLQGQKMKENLIKEQQRDREMEQERKLIAQPARRSNIL